MIEIKTFSTIENCKRNFEEISKDFILQIWVGCEIFGLRSAKLHIYHYDKHSGKRNYYQLDEWVSLYGMINISIKSDLLSKEMFARLKNYYLKFFEEYLDAQKIKSTPSDL